MSENTKKGGVRAVPIVCAATVLAALIVVLFLVLYPSVMARRERTRLAERISAIADASDCAVLRTAMSDYGYGGTADGGEELVEGEQASAYARDLAARFTNAKYLRREDASGGNWDTRVRFSGNGDTVTVYLTSDNTIYFTRGITRFVFRLG